MSAPNFVALLEHCYHEGGSHETWLSNLLDVGQSTLQNGFGYGFSMQRATEHGPVQFLADSRSMAIDPFRETPANDNLDVRAYETLWHPRKPATFISTLISALPTELRGMMFDYLEGARVGDMFGVLGHPTPDTAFALWTGVARRSDISLRARDALLRLRIHVEAGLRLRMLGPAQAVAILTPTGRIEHLTGPAEGRQSCAQLMEHARAIEHARVHNAPIDQERALGAWRALVAGRWSVIERVDTDGKRFYFAFENPPHAVRHRGLSQLESNVIDMFVRGNAGKHIAYALGIAESSVSRHLRSATTRLGFREVSDLLRFAGTVQRLESPVEKVMPLLTPSERGVLELVRQGLSNRSIAELRGTSERTVANQVANLLRKTGALNRRILMTHVAD
jgi:DNA-binding NarL/FixJ family response regulator